MSPMRLKGKQALKYTPDQNTSERRGEREGEGVRTRDEEGKKKVSCERVTESVQERCK